MFIKIQLNQQDKLPPIILLHGWGFNHSIWENLADKLSKIGQVYQVDLPGHGQSPFCEYDLSTLTEKLAENLPKNAVWIGWSLGGLLAMAMAVRKPDHVRALILIASSPRFTITHNWQFALRPEILQKFTQQLQQDTLGTLKRFLILQVKGGEGSTRQLRYLQKFLITSMMPDSKTLQQGLNLLLNTDLRAELQHIRCPALLCLGECDMIVPVKMGKICQQWWKNLQIVEIPKAAHIPFLSHPDIFMQKLTGFLNEHGLT